MARAQADIANTALRIFLQAMGEAYDQSRGFKPYDSKGFREVRAFFDDCCCYCGQSLEDSRTAQDHLVAMNKTGLGLHAWGNVVPACQDCNSKKQGREWHEFLASRAGVDTAERYKRIQSFVAKYEYTPDLRDLREVCEQLYSEVGAIAIALIEAKVRRAQRSVRSSSS